MKSKILVMFSTVLFILVSVSMVAVAQDDSGFVNDPAVNEDANACLAGGSMEGKCNSDANGDGVVTPEEIEWQWTCGWHLIRLEAGIIATGSFPSDCASLIETSNDVLDNCSGTVEGGGLNVPLGSTLRAVNPFNNPDCGVSTIVNLATGDTSIVTISGLDATCVAVGTTDVIVNYESAKGNYSASVSFNCTTGV